MQNSTNKMSNSLDGFAPILEAMKAITDYCVEATKADEHTKPSQIRTCVGVVTKEIRASCEAECKRRHTRYEKREIREPFEESGKVTIICDGRELEECCQKCNAFDEIFVKQAMKIYCPWATTE